MKDVFGTRDTLADVAQYLLRDRSAHSGARQLRVEGRIRRRHRCLQQHRPGVRARPEHVAAPDDLRASASASAARCASTSAYLNEEHGRLQQHRRRHQGLAGHHHRAVGQFGRRAQHRRPVARRGQWPRPVLLGARRVVAERRRSSASRRRSRTRSALPRRPRSTRLAFVPGNEQPGLPGDLHLAFLDRRDSRPSRSTARPAMSVPSCGRPPRCSMRAPPPVAGSCIDNRPPAPTLRELHPWPI